MSNQIFFNQIQQLCENEVERRLDEYLQKLSSHYHIEKLELLNVCKDESLNINSMEEYKKLTVKELRKKCSEMGIRTLHYPKQVLIEKLLSHEASLSDENNIPQSTVPKKHSNTFTKKELVSYCKQHGIPFKHNDVKSVLLKLVEEHNNHQSTQEEVNEEHNNQEEVNEDEETNASPEEVIEPEEVVSPEVVPEEVVSHAVVPEEEESTKIKSLSKKKTTKKDSKKKKYKRTDDIAPNDLQETTLQNENISAEEQVDFLPASDQESFHDEGCHDVPSNIATFPILDPKDYRNMLQNLSGNSITDTMNQQIEKNRSRIYKSMDVYSMSKSDLYDACKLKGIPTTGIREKDLRIGLGKKLREERDLFQSSNERIL